MGLAVGIDLGTTCSCIGVWQNDMVKIIFNKASGKMVTPSYVTFKGSEMLIGDAAKKQMVMLPEKTVFDAKRLIGRKFDDPLIQKDMKSWCFQVVNKSGKPCIEVEYEGEKRYFNPEQISAMVLANLKKTAEIHLRTEVTDAVVTVPAYFNDAQRQATKDAARIAGLNVLRIINEPTAAAIAYGLENNSKEEKNVLVYDLGGGTFDVTVLTIKGLTFTVRSTNGDTHLGGRDFDNIMVDFYVDMLKKKHNKDIRGNHRAMQRLRVACEDAKQALSTAVNTDVVLDNICNEIDLNHEMSRVRFEDRCLHLFKKTLEIVKQALSDAKIDKKDIHDVVLVGGSTRIPRIQAMVEEFFDGKQLCMNVNPDEAVAFGAAVQAAVIRGDHKGHLINEVVLEDAIPMSLGTEVDGHIMRVILPKNMKIPCSESRLFTTCRDQQDNINIRVFEGESKETKDNNLLDSFDLTGFPLQPKGVSKFKVTFEVDKNGILSVSAVDTAMGKRKSITIKNERGRFSQGDIDRMKLENERQAHGTSNNKEKDNAKSELEDYVNFVQHKLESMPIRSDGSEIQKNRLVAECFVLTQLLKNDGGVDKKRCEQELQSLKELFQKFTLEK